MNKLLTESSRSQTLNKIIKTISLVFWPKLKGNDWLRRRRDWIIWTSAESVFRWRRTFSICDVWWGNIQSSSLAQSFDWTSDSLSSRLKGSKLFVYLFVYWMQRSDRFSSCENYCVFKQKCTPPPTKDTTVYTDLVSVLGIGNDAPPPKMMTSQRAKP